MIEGSCHCGAVKIELPRRPRRLTSCNCSICRRLGTLWGYYPMDQVKLTRGRRGTTAYVWGDKRLEFHSCRKCGCTTHWEPVDKSRGSRVGINARLLDPADIEGARVRRLDGAKTWKFLD